MDVGPEVARAKTSAQRDGDALKHGGNGDDAAGAVVERHAVVAAVAGGAGLGGVGGGEEGGVDGCADVGALGGERDAFGEAGGAAEGLSIRGMIDRRQRQGAGNGEG